ncbi:MAG: glycosyltransferase family 61 protein, partial [Okeania sp. SIO3B3]|nr:glycosyltransferase family 61 protein [Okeania sp. SIO3B3]
TDISTGCAEVIISSTKLPPIHYIDGTVAFLSAKWGGNVYYHWMFDVVIRIGLLSRSGWISKIDRFVFSKCDKKFHQQTLEALEIPQEKIIESRFIPHIKAKKLIVPSFTIKQSGIRISKWGCEFIRNLFLKSEKIGKLSESPERIFISRKLASWRRVVNEDEVVSFLAKFGFISITLESLTVAEQAALMSKVKVIVAPHGAGLTNLVFCNSESKVIEIFSPKYINSIYWKISSFYHLSHYYLIGENFENDNSDKQPWKPDILVDIKQLRKIMKLAEIE